MLFKQMEKTAIWEPNLGTYLHLSSHLWGKQDKIIVVFRLVEGKENPPGSKLIRSTCVYFGVHNMVTNDGSAYRLGKIDGQLQKVMSFISPGLAQDSSQDGLHNLHTARLNK